MQHVYYREYKNIRIRPLEIGDIEKLRIWRNDKSNVSYLKSIPYITKEMQMKWFEQYLKCKNELIFAIEEIIEFNRVVGSLSLYEINDGRCLLGKILIGDTETRGHGIGTNAAKAAIAVATEQLGISRIGLYVFKENIVAVKAYKHAGFKIIDEHFDSMGKIEYTMEFIK